MTPSLAARAVDLPLDHPECPSGGHLVEMGEDQNRDSFLDDDEVDPTLSIYVCDGADGLDGRDGVDGVSGYQIVSRVYTSIPIGASAYFSVDCPTGKRAIGGGAAPYAQGGVIFSSVPSGGGAGWTVGYINSTGLDRNTLTVKAICVYI